MEFTVKELLDQKIDAEDGSFPVNELFYMPEDRTLRYALIDTGGWFHSAEVLASIRRLSRNDDGGWSLHMSRAELDDAPVIDTLEPDMVNLPPLVVGPFGYTFSPLAMAASIENATGDMGPDPDATSDDALRDGTGRILHLERVTQLIGRDAYTDSGPVGEITDLTVNEDMTLSDAVVGSGDRIPLRRMRRVAEQGHVLFG